MDSSTRHFHLKIWYIAFGYFLFYAPYSALIKATTTGLLPGINKPSSGFRLLPATIVGTVAVGIGITSALGWWKYAGRRRFLGLNIPFPNRLVFLSGLGTAIIISTTTLAYTFTGVSILFALLLLRGGVLILAPAVDLLFGRRMRWFSLVALALSFIALLVALTDVKNYQLTLVSSLNIAGYLGGYLLRLPCINQLAKCDDETITRRYLVEELMVAAILLVLITAVLATMGQGTIMLELRQGFTEFFTSSLTPPGLLIGALYSGLYFFGTLVYLDRRENTFCIPLNRGSSLLAGVFATCFLALFLGQNLPSLPQVESCVLIIVALLFLSPLHHARRYAGNFWKSLRSTLQLAPRTLDNRPSAVPASGPNVLSMIKNVVPDEDAIKQSERVFLFVCSGNTCRSPMAAAIGNAEIAVRLRLPIADTAQTDARALSAGVSARVGAPMTPEAQQALHLLDIPVPVHSAQNLTADLAHRVERIFCMTQDHLSAVISMVPTVAAKTHCLDPGGDVEDPIGKELEAYVNCARRIRGLVRFRLDEIGFQAG